MVDGMLPMSNCGPEVCLMSAMSSRSRVSQAMVRLERWWDWVEVGYCQVPLDSHLLDFERWCLSLAWTDLGP